MCFGLVLDSFGSVSRVCRLAEHAEVKCGMRSRVRDAKSSAGCWTRNAKTGKTRSSRLPL
eukprot:scaffold803_cov310-Pinguiococcus_pyrenoidosus.AAC.91